LDVVTRARNGLIIVINCDEKIRNYDDYAFWKKTIEGTVNQSTGSNADAKDVLMIMVSQQNFGRFLLYKLFQR
jgi:hypothetical protein